MKISANHFGVCIHPNNYDIGPGSTFDKTVDYLGSTAIRWPSGVAEWDEYRHNDGTLLKLLRGPTTANDQIATLMETIAYAERKGLKIHLVVPTKTFWINGVIDRMGLVNIAKVYVDIIAAHSCIVSIELGNEYWGIELIGKDGQVAKMTAAQYAQTVNIWINALISNGLREKSAAKIFVQGTNYWNFDIPVDAIGTSIDYYKRKHVDGIVNHFYPGTLPQAMRQEEANGHGPVIAMKRGYTVEAGYRDDLLYYISETNAFSKADDPIIRQRQATILVAIMHKLILQGVDLIDFWGANYQSLNTRLTGVREGQMFATPGGAMVRLMRYHLGGFSAQPGTLPNHPYSFCFRNESTKKLCWIICNWSDSTIPIKLPSSLAAAPKTKTFVYSINNPLTDDVDGYDSGLPVGQIRTENDRNVLRPYEVVSIRI